MSRFLPYIHNMRGLAILLIVGVHARGSHLDWESNPHTLQYLRTFLDNGTVVFVFIAGFLFQYLTREKFIFKQYMEQKFKVVILPYLIISIPLIFIHIGFGLEDPGLPEHFNTFSTIKKVLFLLITGLHLVPLWFIPMVFLIYLTSPLLHWLDQYKSFYRYAVPVILLMGLFTFRPPFNSNPLMAYVHFLPIYITGMWASYYRDKILASGWHLAAPLIMLYAVISIFEIRKVIELYRRYDFEMMLDDSAVVFNVYVFKAVILSFILLVVFYKLRNKSLPFLELLGNYSFGIYFLHHIFISIWLKITSMTDIKTDFTFLTFLIYFTIVMLLSIVSVYAIKKLTQNYSRYLIGS